MAGEKSTGFLEIDPVKAKKFIEGAKGVSDLCWRIAEGAVRWLVLDYQELQKVWTRPEKGRIPARL